MIGNVALVREPLKEDLRRGDPESVRAPKAARGFHVGGEDAVAHGC